MNDNKINLTAPSLFSNETAKDPFGLQYFGLSLKKGVKSQLVGGHFNALQNRRIVGVLSHLDSEWWRSPFVGGLTLFSKLIAIHAQVVGQLYYSLPWQRQLGQGHTMHVSRLRCQLWPFRLSQGRHRRFKPMKLRRV